MEQECPITVLHGKLAILPQGSQGGEYKKNKHGVLVRESGDNPYQRVGKVVATSQFMFNDGSRADCTAKVGDRVAYTKDPRTGIQRQVTTGGVTYDVVSELDVDAILPPEPEMPMPDADDVVVGVDVADGDSVSVVAEVDQGSGTVVGVHYPGDPVPAGAKVES